MLTIVGHCIVHLGYGRELSYLAADVGVSANGLRGTTAYTLVGQN